MIEAVENQSPDVIIVDERSNVHPVHVYTRASLTCTARAWHVCTQVIIVDELSNKEQCNAARTITGRGVAVVATVHGDGLASLLHDHDRSLLVGGVNSVTLSAREAEARPDKLRQVRAWAFSCAS